MAHIAENGQRYFIAHAPPSSFYKGKFYWHSKDTSEIEGTMDAIRQGVQVSSLEGTRISLIINRWSASHGRIPHFSPQQLDPSNGYKSTPVRMDNLLREGIGRYELQFDRGMPGWFDLGVDRFANAIAKAGGNQLSVYQLPFYVTTFFGQTGTQQLQTVGAGSTLVLMENRLIYSATGNYSQTTLKLPD